MLDRLEQHTMDSISISSLHGQALYSEIVSAFRKDWATNPWFHLWKEHTASFIDISEADGVLAQTGFGIGSIGSGGSLFCAQTYAAIALDALSSLVGMPAEGVAQPSFFDWLRLRHAAFRAEGISRIRKAVEADSTELLSCSPEDFSALLGSFFQSLFPPKLRHLLGEYYTPEWLIDDASELFNTADLPRRLSILDPAAGSGGFALRLLSRLKEKTTFESATITLSDINPVAVIFARANLAYCNMRGSAYGYPPLGFSVHLSDTICDPSSHTDAPLFSGPEATTTILGREFDRARKEPALAALVREFHARSEEERDHLRSLVQQIVNDRFRFVESVKADIVCGNPPWISWDGLSPHYRAKISSQWSGSTLVTNKGWRAKVAAGKNDVSTLFVLRCAERHAAEGGLMVFALPISVFQARHASAGFRLFRAGPSRRYAPTALVDLTSTTVFSDALNRACMALFRVDAEPKFPILYGKLSGSSGQKRIYEWHQARPIDVTAEGSPIVVANEQEVELFSRIGPSDYRARGGVNTGGANGIMWLEEIERTATGVRVTNTGKVKGGSIRRVEATIEHGAVAPLLAGRDIRRWRAAPSRRILFLYNEKDPKHALPEPDARRQFPRAYAFASEFEEELKGRKEYHRWGGAGPFYELYRIGPYTFADHKVVWQHTGFRGRMNVAVLETIERPIVVPDQKVILIACSERAEAHYICAYLASSLVSSILRKYIGIDTSTHILDFIRLRRFSPSDRDHLRLAQLSYEAHELARNNQNCDSVERQVDSVAEQIFFRSK